MTEILIHIGYPKTATTTIEDGLLVGLHNKGLINYLGRSDFTRNRYFRQSALIRDYLYLGHHLRDDDIVIKPELLNVLSDDNFTHPGPYKERSLNIKVDPYSFPEKLAKYFCDKAEKIRILVTLRSQQTLIYSQYVQNYYLFIDDIENNTPSKHIFNNQGYLKKDMFLIYNFSDVLEKYAEYFGVKNIHLLLFEDLINCKHSFVKELSDILNADESLAFNLLTDVHYRERKKSDNGYFVSVMNRNLPGNLLLMLKNGNLTNRMYKFILKSFRKNKKTTSAIINIMHKMNLRKSQLIPKLTEDQKEIIFNEFKASNLKLSAVFNVSKDKLERYGYI